MGGVDGHKQLRALYEAHWRSLFGYACRRVATVEDAADVVSEVFLVAWRRIDEVPAGPSARLWLFGVARLTVQNHLRGEQRRDRLGGALLAAFRENHGDDPSQLTDRSESARQVDAALTQLPDADRELMSLVAWEQLSVGDAAQVLGINPTAARARLSRARRRLRLLLAEDPLPPKPTLTPLTQSWRNY
jgi:RNA polymerase sigma factor (sigma-70 family)